MKSRLPKDIEVMATSASEQLKGVDEILRLLGNPTANPYGVRVERLSAGLAELCLPFDKPTLGCDGTHSRYSLIAATDFAMRAAVSANTRSHRHGEPLLSLLW